MLRLLRPRRVIEIGAGFSSAVMLDAIPADDSPKFTFVEPFPARLKRLLRPEDSPRFEVTIPRQSRGHSGCEPLEAAGIVHTVGASR
jgi:hypothetical protein